MKIYTARIYRKTELGSLLIGEIEQTRTGVRTNDRGEQEEYSETSNIFLTKEEAVEVAENALRNVPDAEGYIVESIPVEAYGTRTELDTTTSKEG